MIKMLKASVVSVTLLVATTVVADEAVIGDKAFLQIQQTYQTATFIAADFQQQRQVKFISKPLISEGEFVFARKHGLIWQINTPFFSKLLYNDGDIYQSTTDVDKAQMDKADPDMMAAAMTKIMDDILSGQWALLNDKFSVIDSSELTNGDKQVRLKATDQLVAKVVTTLTIHFSKLIETVEFSDADGNVTKLTFRNQTYQQTPLTDAELARFN